MNEPRKTDFKPKWPVTLSPEQEALLDNFQGNGVNPLNEEDRRLLDPLEGRYKVRADMPDCCANCKNNLWNEDGPHCAVDLTTGNDIYDVLDCGHVDWNGWCPRHNRGEPRHDLPLN